MAETTPKTIFEEKFPEKLKENPQLAKDVGAVIVFEISGPAGGTWTADFTKSEGWISSGAGATPKMTVSMADEDLIKIVSEAAQSADGGHERQAEVQAVRYGAGDEAREIVLGSRCQTSRAHQMQGGAGPRSGAYPEPREDSGASLRRRWTAHQCNTRLLGGSFAATLLVGVACYSSRSNSATPCPLRRWGGRRFLVLLTHHPRPPYLCERFARCRLPQ